MIAEDLQAHFTGSAPVVALAPGGFFWRKPQNVNELNGQNYLIYTRPDLGEDDVRNQHRVQIVCFSRDMVELENLTEAVKNSLRGVNEINGKEYYMIQLINQSDSDEKLDNGYYYNILNYFFRKAA